MNTKFSLINFYMSREFCFNDLEICFYHLSIYKIGKSVRYNCRPISFTSYVIGNTDKQKQYLPEKDFSLPQKYYGEN